LSETINYLFSHPKVLKKYGQNAKKRVLTLFTIKNNSKKHLELYSKVSHG